MINSLKEAIRQRRIEEGLLPESCYDFKMNAHTLRLKSSSGETWVLPWHHFVICRLEDESERETLRLTFVGHEVVVRGLNLNRLADKISRQCLAGLHTIEEKYARAEAGEAFVFQIEVRPREGI